MRYGGYDALIVGKEVIIDEGILEGQVEGKKKFIVGNYVGVLVYNEDDVNDCNAAGADNDLVEDVSFNVGASERDAVRNAVGLTDGGEYGIKEGKLVGSIEGM